MLHRWRLSTVSGWATETCVRAEKCHGGLAMKNVLFLAAAATSRPARSLPKQQRCGEMDGFCFWRSALTSPPSAFSWTAVCGWGFTQHGQKLPQVQSSDRTDIHLGRERSVSQIHDQTDSSPPGASGQNLIPGRHGPCLGLVNGQNWVREQYKADL